MGLMRTLARARYVYGWRIRHWWLDTREGRIAQLSSAIVVVLALVAGTVRATLRSLAPPNPERPRESILFVVVMLIVALVAALVVMATMPKPKQQPPAKTDTPSVQDGQSVQTHFGTCRVKDPALLAWKVTGRDPIQSKQGKK